MTPFHVGMKVVCVDAEGHGKYVPPGYVGSGHMDGLERGKTYTVREVLGEFHGFQGCCIFLEEITRPSCGVFQEEPPYCAARFRPVVKTDISIFQAMLVPSPNLTEKVDG